jgi:hypothetical protein
MRSGLVGKSDHLRPIYLIGGSDGPTMSEECNGKGANCRAPKGGGGMMNKGRFEVRRRGGRIVIFNFAVMIAPSVISSMPLSSFGLKVCQSPISWG